MPDKIDTLCCALVISTIILSCSMIISANSLKCGIDEMVKSINRMQSQHNIVLIEEK